MPSSMWSTLTIGRYSGRTLPQVVLSDADWFFWAREKAIFHAPQSQEAERLYRRAKAILKDVLAAPDRWTYTDLAIASPRDDEFEALDLYHATDGGEAALDRKRREDDIRIKGHEPAH